MTDYFTEQKNRIRFQSAGARRIDIDYANGCFHPRSARGDAFLAAEFENVEGNLSQADIREIIALAEHAGLMVRQ